MAQAAVLMVALALEDQQRAPLHENDEHASGGPSAVAPPPEPSAPNQEPPPAAIPGEKSAVPAPEAPLAPTIEPRASSPKQAPMAGSASSIVLRAGALMDVGFLPTVAFGPEAGMGLGIGRFRVELAGFWLPWRTSEPGAAGRVSVTLWALRPLGCVSAWRSARGVFSVDACLGLELGRARSRGSELSERKEPAWMYRAGWLSLRLHTRLTERWGILLEPAAAVPLGRPRYVSETTGNEPASELHTPSAVSARLTLGLERRF
ncbi:MAG: hypothetical protein QM778_32735 [Myxococcales bacterium]